jgi:hypothetical protein
MMMQPKSARETPSSLSAHMQRCGLELGQIARASGVPHSVVWRIVHNQAVTTRNANRVRLGIWKLSGVPYLEPIVTLDETSATGPLPVISRRDEQQVKMRRTRLLPTSR